MLKYQFRSRLLYLGFALAAIGLGLLSRSTMIELPNFVATYSGDAIWAMMVFFLACAAFPRWSTIKLAIVAIMFSFMIEFSQLYHAPWIDALRQNTFGALVLGHGFKFSDLVCYAVGVGVGCAIRKVVT